MKDCSKCVCRRHSCIDGPRFCNALSPERDIWRLRVNWLFVVMSIVMRGVNLLCVIPTNHQFIVNPTEERLNITDEKIEPGLEQSESFYSLTYTVLFVGHATGSLVAGLAFNYIPAWYLFLVSSLSHTLGYLLYALATSGWMMMLARGLAGIQLGAGTVLTFTYFSTSLERYCRNMKVLGKFEEKKMTRVKGYLFSTFSIGTVVGYFLTLGFVLVLAQFPDTPQFRTAGWFCVAVGAAVILLQLLLFHGECAWKCHRVNLSNCRIELSFWKSKDKWSCHDVFVKVLIPMYVIIAGSLKGMRYVINEVLVNPIASDSFGFSDEDMTYLYTVYLLGTCVALILLYVLQYFKISSYLLTVVGLMCTIMALLVMTDWQAIGSDSCTEHSLFHHPQLADQYRLQLAGSNVSESGLVSVQSLQVVEGEVYQMAVNRCQSAGEHCHWIPNSQVTHKHCSDCQPICRSTQHTLNFFQFIVGLFFYFSTVFLMYIGVFLLLSESVGKSYQGISAGLMTTLIGVSRSIFPKLLDYFYELEQKRTYLPMLIQVGIYIPLLGGLLLLYPWLGGPLKVNYSQETNNLSQEHETDKLIDSK